LTYLYEGMFLIDNDLVRAGWADAKSIVTQTLEKHGATIQSARRWAERPLAYPIKGRRRATYLLAYYEMDGDAMPAFQRDLEISDGVLRYLNLRVDALPEGEDELSKAELADDFSVPEPPDNDAVEERKIADDDDSSGDDVDVPDDVANADLTQSAN
jgi:small subunit ribosomal protein S6